MTRRTVPLSLLFLGVLLSLPKCLFAAPSNGTRFPPQGKLEMGYEYNLMYKRPLDRSYGNLKTGDNFIIASFGIFDWFCIDGKVGLGEVKQKGGIHLPKLEYRTGFAGGYGFRIKFFEYEKLKVRIIIGAQHISVHPKDRSIDDDKFECFLDDWQVCGIVSKRVKFANPYLGMKLSDCEIVYNINKHDKKRRYSENHLGFVFGSDFYFLEDKIRLNAEGRLFDETAFSLAAAYLF